MGDEVGHLASFKRINAAEQHIGLTGRQHRLPARDGCRYGHRDTFAAITGDGGSEHFDLEPTLLGISLGGVQNPIQVVGFDAVEVDQVNSAEAQTGGLLTYDRASALHPDHDSTQAPQFTGHTACECDGPISESGWWMFASPDQVDVITDH